jgi:hypothetical protein
VECPVCAERGEEQDDEHLSEKVSTDHVPLLRMVEIRSVVEFDAAPLLLVNQEQKRIGR